MADNFGLKIGLEGEKEFKKALNEINQSFKVLGSEMKLVQSAFDKNDNSVEALTARNQVLNKEIEAQKQKIETLRAALSNAAESFGENDRRTQSWQIQLNNATATLNDMERELSQNNDALKTADREIFGSFKSCSRYVYIEYHIILLFQAKFSQYIVFSFFHITINELWKIMNNLGRNLSFTGYFFPRFPADFRGSGLAKKAVRVYSSRICRTENHSESGIWRKQYCGRRKISI